jgi:hypothetical protein
MDEEPEAAVEIVVESPDEPDTTPIIVAPESGAVEDAIALVEHVEGDTDHWVENAVEHERIWESIRRLETPAVVVDPEPVESIEEIVEEIIEEKAEEAEAEGEPEIEMDVPAVEEEIAVKTVPPWDIFRSIHGAE